MSALQPGADECRDTMSLPVCGDCRKPTATGVDFSLPDPNAASRRAAKLGSCSVQRTAYPIFSTCSPTSVGTFVLWMAVVAGAPCLRLWRSCELSGVDDRQEPRNRNINNVVLVDLVKFGARLYRSEPD